MSRLRLRVNMFGDVGLGTMFVLADVYPLDRAAPRDLRQRLRGIRVPAGDEYDRFKGVEVPTGDYLVEVTLPSGDVLSKEVAVAESGPAEIEVALQADSPREWLAWQHLQGNVGSADPVRSGKAWALESLVRGQSSSSRFHTKARGGIGFPMELEMDGAAPPAAARVYWCVDGDPGAPAGRTWALLRDLIQKGGSPGEILERLWHDLPALDRMTELERSIGDGRQDTNAFRFTKEGPVGSAGSGRTTHGGRRYVLVRDVDTARIVCAPVPWYDIDHSGNECEFEVLSVLGSAGVTTVIRDPALGSAIGYMTNNALQRARNLIDRAEDMLWHKVANPLGAAAGAYVLLATETERKPADWHRWIGRLRRNYDWLPDGSIAYATMKLNYQETDEDVDEALEALLEACRRGIPFFSLGVRWLLDGLTSFAEDEHYAARAGEVEAALDSVRTVARRVNFRQPFTSIELAR